MAYGAEYWKRWGTSNGKRRRQQVPTRCDEEAERDERAVRARARGQVAGERRGSGGEESSGDAKGVGVAEGSPYFKLMAQ